MARRLLNAIGFAAATFDITSVIFFLRWSSKTDWFFGHYQGPPDQIFTAVGTGIAGILATVIWFARAYGQRFLTLRSNESPLERLRLKWLHATPLLVLALATGLVLLIGIPTLPRAWKMASLQPLDLRTASVPQLIKALKSGDYEQRGRAALCVVESINGESGEMPSGMPALTGKRVDVLENRKHLPELVDALASALTGPDLVGWYAAEALGAIGPEAKAAIPALERVLNRDDETMRQRALIALSRIDPNWKSPAVAK